MAINQGQVEDLVEIGMGLDLFRSSEGLAYASFTSGGRTVNAPLGSSEFRRHLRAAYRARHKRGANSNALKEALEDLAHHAHEQGKVHDVFVRTASHGDTCYLDLADGSGTVVRIDGGGWRVDPTPPVRFERPAAMHPLPIPESGGDLDALWRFFNLGEQDRLLMIACLVCMLRHPGPYPILVLEGGQGTGKSTTTRVVRNLVDPHALLIRRRPREIRDLEAALANSYVLALDNLDRLPDWLSDALCTVATGGVIGGRELYETTKESGRNYQRPMILNGITDVTGREDMRDRSMVVRLEKIQRRRLERDFWREFDLAQGQLLGSLLDALGTALRVLPTLDPNDYDLPRMADFALLGIALEQGLGWESGSFLAAYSRNQKDVIDEASSVDTVVQMVRWAMGNLERQGHEPQMMQTATELWAWFDSHGPRHLKRDKDWPASARSFAARLRRAAPVLASYGIELDFHRASDAARQRLIRITVARPHKKAA